MQNPKHMKAECATCGAAKNEPCLTVDGIEAEKVHWGRPGQSKPKFKFRGIDTYFELLEFDVIEDLIDRDTATGAAAGSVLFPGTNICVDCGEPYDQPGLVTRCQKRHTAPRVARLS